MRVSRSHARPVVVPASPPQRSTTCTPRWYALSAGPTFAPRERVGEGAGHRLGPVGEAPAGGEGA